MRERIASTKRRIFSILLDVSKLIVSELNLETVLQLVASKARDIVQADLVVVPMLNEERDRYTYMAASGIDAEEVVGTKFSGPCRHVRLGVAERAKPGVWRIESVLAG